MEYLAIHLIFYFNTRNTQHHKANSDIATLVLSINCHTSKAKNETKMKFTKSEAK